ncbi:MAG: DUF2238 domain-containing protein [Planctomycetota bacterium]|nr:DUF2238 domain-containing protein [Planctomycetota bacterium]
MTPNDSGPTTGERLQATPQAAVLGVAQAPRARWRDGRFAQKLKRKPGRLRGPAIFTVSYMLMATAVALSRGNHEFIFYALMMAFFIYCAWELDRRAHLSQPVLWMLSLWGLFHMAGGNVPIPAAWSVPADPAVLYNFKPAPWLPKYDQVVHFYGFMVAMMTCWEGMEGMTHNTIKPKLGPLTIAVLAAMGLGAFNELVEFVATRILPETNVGGYENTGWDLVANTLGAIVGAMIIGWTPFGERRQPDRADLANIVRQARA